MKTIKNKILVEDLKEICGYLELTEQKDFQESGKPSNHIWKRVLRVKKYLKNYKNE
jgi:hypothetical protein